MLAYLLAWIIGLGSLGIYLAAFFFPEVHRKNDFIWSGIGFFYALVLWVYAERLRGGLLLGQTASVALLVWFGWQTLKLRRELTPSAQQTAIPDTTAVQAKVGGITSNLQRRLATLPIRKNASRQPGVATGSPKPARPPSTAPSSSSPASSISQSETVTQLPNSPVETAAPAPSSTAGETVASEPEVLSSTGVTSGSPPAANTDAPETAKGPNQTKLAGLQATATNLVTNLKNQIQGILRRRNFNLGTPSAKQGSSQKSKPAQAVKPAAPAVTRTVIPPESVPTTTEVQPEDSATSAAAAGNRDNETAPADQPGLSEGVQATPIEEIAPEVELAPPAEPASQWNMEMSIETGPALMDEGSEETPEDAASLPANEEHPELVRPAQPDPSLIEAAQRAVEARPDPSEGPSSSTSASE